MCVRKRVICHRDVKERERERERERDRERERRVDICMSRVIGRNWWYLR